MPLKFLSYFSDKRWLDEMIKTWKHKNMKWWVNDFHLVFHLASKYCHNIFIPTPNWKVIIEHSPANHNQATASWLATAAQPTKWYGSCNDLPAPLAQNSFVVNSNFSEAWVNSHSSFREIWIYNKGNQWIHTHASEKFEYTTKELWASGAGRSLRGPYPGVWQHVIASGPGM